MSTVLMVFLAMGIAGVAAVELALRRMSTAAVPLFRRIPGRGYAMRPDQRGKFMNRNAWVYNSLGMRVADEPATLAGASLIVGDSVVDGGNRIDQADTLVELLRQRTTGVVWPVACHGWALANELAALRALPGWQQAARIVFVLNTSDFGQIDTRGGEINFPTRRPLLQSAWLARRQLYRSPIGARLFGHIEADRGDAAFRTGLIAEFAETLASYAGQVSIVCYPKRGEDLSREPFFAELASASRGQRIRLIDLAAWPQWGDHCYHDTIHPNRQGIRVFADCITDGAF